MIARIYYYYAKEKKVLSITTCLAGYYIMVHVLMTLGLIA